ncbi:MAG TPA: PQQ-binding-like beta-propeller repeat protein [Candidatus Paceibacterota bacterium]|nr:PQQ-binding-like beta-propeller repeat protein [Verrucomicrobiota bacterium]HSA08866.1 PQQ-binding-like beta-propeller repeat protein [Candidatus Paceibacterota bacterium]
MARRTGTGLASTNAPTGTTQRCHRAKVAAQAFLKAESRRDLVFVDKPALVCEMIWTMTDFAHPPGADLPDLSSTNAKTLMIGPMKKWCLSALLTAAITSPAWGMSVSGRVFADRNGDGVAQATEPGLGRVAVSDGNAVVLTSKRGDYQLETEPGRLVFVTLPRGYRASRSFYATAAAGKAADFGLVDWEASRRSGVRFVQITDIHITQKEDTVSTFSEDIEEINALQPAAAFVIATGDLVNNGKETPEFENYVRAMAGFRIPLFNVPGNHDVKAPGSMAHYHQYLGPDHYSFNVGDGHFVMLNCMSFDEQQKAWIEKDLAAAPKGAARVFALHYLPTRRQVEYLKQLGAVAVLSGHWHGNRVEQGLGVLDLNTPPLRFGGIDRHPRSFRLLEIKGGKVDNELRLGGFKHHAAVVSPSGTCVTEKNRLPVVVNAYDSRIEVAAVECRAAGRRVALKRASPWTWLGDLKLPAGARGEQTLVADIRAVNGETWQAEASFQLADQAGSATEPKPPLQLKWAASTGGFIGISSPRKGNDCVAVGIDDQGDLKRCGVSAFAASGKRLWHFATDSAVKNNIAAADGRIFATSVAGWLYALDEATGKLLWKAELDRERERWEVAATTAHDGVVYVGAHSYIAAFETQTGRRIWDKRHGQSDWWPSSYTVPTIAGRKLLLTTRNGAWALDAKTGEMLWKLDGRFNGCLAVGNTLYTTRNNALCALDLAGGKLLWTGKEQVGDTASAPALAGDKLVMGTADGRVCAFATTDGSLLWAAQTGPSLSSLQPYQRGGSDVNSSPAILGDTVYVGASDGAVHALRLADGAKLGSYSLGVPIASSPFIAGDRLYLGGYDGNLYAFAVGK